MKRASSARLRSEVSGPFVAGKEDGLRRQRATIGLNPFAARAVERARPKANRFAPQRGVGHFQHNAAYVLVGEKIVAAN